MPTLFAAEAAHDDYSGPVIARRRPSVDSALDITPMIDVTFLLLIFFLVTNTPDRKTAINLPAAENGAVVSGRKSFVVSLAVDTPQTARIYLADGKLGSPLGGPPGVQEAAIRAAIESKHREGIDRVILKAEKRVPYAEVSRVLRAASIDGVRVHVAVMEQR